MPPIVVARLAFNERADAKMWDHGVEFDRLSELLENRHVITRNRKRRAAQVLSSDTTTVASASWPRSYPRKIRWSGDL